tara:strand:+ start:838 stop:1128 length:291 start_codon:yes stop_codon:yes gene_type:complete
MSGTVGLRLESTSLIIRALNCSDVTYLYPKYPPPNIDADIIKLKIDNIWEIFVMIKFAILKALSLTSVLVLLLIVALSPLYVTMGIMTRQMEEKVN